MKELQAATEALSKRVYEHQERPKALEALRYTLNQTETFFVTVKNMSDLEEPVFTKVEMDTLEKLINGTKVTHQSIPPRLFTSVTLYATMLYVLSVSGY